uniref:(California timema) hypothetical protein n=1 Tax=Timema californicum TaxID=61474 RepID=A0A7R9P5X9_TIMCA|nr:unnamed protein product [Timema californicum]
MVTGAGMTIPYWDFIGSTMVTNNYVRLTPDDQSKRGLLWNSVPCSVRNWELQVHFKVHGKGKDLYGDGLAIWYAKDRMIPGDVFGNQDFFQGLAVILDTYSNHNGPHNHQHPYVSAMVNNGSLHYDHDRDGTHTQLAGCEAKFRNVAHDTHIAIRYENDVLTVSTDVENKAAWKECLSVKGVRLPTGYYFGVTAANRRLVGHPRHHVHQIVRAGYAGEYHVEDPKPSSLSGIKIFLLMLVGTLAVIACVVIGIMFYQKHQENSRKRFY